MDDQLFKQFSLVKRKEERGSFLLLFFSWVILQIALIYKLGIVTDFEAKKYITQADSLINSGAYTSNNFLFYSTEILLISFSKVTNTFPWLVVMVQLLMNFISIFCFYKLCSFLTQKRKVSTIATLVFLSMYYYHLYNVYLFTESLYFSFSIMYTFFLFKYVKLTPPYIAATFLGLVLLYFTRPTGLFFVPATILFLLIKFKKQKSVKFCSTILMVIVALSYYLLTLSMQSGGEFDFLLPYVNEHVICGIPTIKEKHNLYVPRQKNSIEALLYIITNHWSLFSKLAFKRLIAFWGVYRPYFSIHHNIFICSFFFSVYTFILIGLIKMVKLFKAEAAFLIAIILLTAITVMLSCDEWHNRFLLALTPLLLLLALGTFVTKRKQMVKQP